MARLRARAVAVCVLILAPAMWGRTHHPRCSELGNRESGDCEACTSATVHAGGKDTCIWAHGGKDSGTAFPVPPDVALPSGCCVSSEELAPMSVCVKQVAAAWGTVEYSKSGSACPKTDDSSAEDEEDEETEDKEEQADGSHTFLGPEHTGHADPRADRLRELLHRLVSLEHSLRRSVSQARKHPLSMAHARAACANLELLQSRAYTTAAEVTEHVFGGSLFLGAPGSPVPGGGAPALSAVARPPVPGQPQFLDWAHRRLLQQDAGERIGREVRRAQLALEPSLPVDEKGRQVMPGTSARSLRRARAAMRRASGVRERQDSLGEELDAGWLIGPLSAPEEAEVERMPPFETWAGAFSWALASVAELTVPGASSDARAADLLQYHVPRLCAVVSTCAEARRPAFNFTVLGPSSGEEMGWLECPFCPPDRAAVLFAGERTAQDIPEDKATGRAAYKHPGMAEVLGPIAGFCRKVLPADAPLLAKHSEDLVRALEGAERAMHDEAGAAAVVSAVTAAAEAASALPQAPKPKD